MGFILGSPHIQHISSRVSELKNSLINPCHNYNADLWIPPAKKGVDRQSARDYLLDKLKDDKDKDIVRGMGTYTLECVAIHTSTEYNNALLTNLYRINRVVIKRALKRVMLGWVSDDKITISIQIGQN
ncbi:hypothetical protein ACJX0J_037354 [Zea mays]